MVKIAADPVEPAPAMGSLRNSAPDTLGFRFLTMARVAFGVFFLGSAILKLWKTDVMTALLVGAEFTTPLPLIYLAAACQAAAGSALIAGILVREAAIGLIAYVAVVNYYLHAFWQLNGEAASIQFQLFSKNVGIMTGLLAIAGTSGWFRGLAYDGSR